MRAEVVIASVIAVSGVLAAGQAIHRGLQDPPPPPKAVDPASTRCADPYAPVVDGDRPSRIAVVGDLVTAWKAPYDRSTSWVTYATTDGVRSVGSWVDPQATIRELANEVGPSDADVLVVLAGTNDLERGAVNDEIELNLQRIVAASRVDHVLISSIPPVEDQPQETADFNEFLARVAYRHDWSFVDAGSTVVGPACRYRSGLTVDGERPAPRGARLIGEAVHGALTTRTDLAPGPRRR